MRSWSEITVSISAPWVRRFPMTHPQAHEMPVAPCERRRFVRQTSAPLKPDVCTAQCFVCLFCEGGRTENFVLQIQMYETVERKMFIWGCQHHLEDTRCLQCLGYVSADSEGSIHNQLEFRGWVVVVVGRRRRGELGLVWEWMVWELVWEVGLGRWFWEEGGVVWGGRRREGGETSVCVETTATWRSMKAAAAHKHASPVLERLYPGLQHLQHRVSGETFFSLYKKHALQEHVDHIPTCCHINLQLKSFSFHPDPLQLLYHNLQLFALLLKSLDVVQNVQTYRHRVHEGSAITLLLLHQNTNLFVQKRDTDRTLHSPQRDLRPGTRSLISAPTLRPSSWNVHPFAFSTHPSQSSSLPWPENTSTTWSSIHCTRSCGTHLTNSTEEMGSLMIKDAEEREKRFVEKNRCMMEHLNAVVKRISEPLEGRMSDLETRTQPRWTAFQKK